ncbi:hypothetical protein [Flammeovirga sp. OC4]|uniref:hypothetical protein n=1 Tax=Flammeovirga sp. OC4 TaxID=1382345 RepID=UPI0005C5453D|nr:hypothetical protein [Flammeovirga sp. OC4]
MNKQKILTLIFLLVGLSLTSVAQVTPFKAPPSGEGEIIECDPVIIEGNSHNYIGETVKYTAYNFCKEIVADPWKVTGGSKIPKETGPFMTSICWENENGEVSYESLVVLPTRAYYSKSYGGKPIVNSIYSLSFLTVTTSVTNPCDQTHRFSISNVGEHDDLPNDTKLVWYKVASNDTISVLGDVFIDDSTEDDRDPFTVPNNFIDYFTDSTDLSGTYGICLQNKSTEYKVLLGAKTFTFTRPEPPSRSEIEGIEPNYEIIGNQESITIQAQVNNMESYAVFVPSWNNDTPIYASESNVIDYTISRETIPCDGNRGFRIVAYNADGCQIGYKEFVVRHVNKEPEITGINSSYEFDEYAFPYNLQPTITDHNSVIGWYLILTDGDLIDDSLHPDNQRDEMYRFSSGVNCTLNSDLITSFGEYELRFYYTKNCTDGFFFKTVNIIYDKFIDYGVFHIRGEENPPLFEGIWKYKNSTFTDDNIESVLNEDGLYECTLDDEIRHIYMWTPQPDDLFEVVTNQGCTAGYFKGLKEVASDNITFSRFPDGNPIKVNVKDLSQENYQLDLGNGVPPLTQSGNIVLEGTKKGDAYTYSSDLTIVLDLPELNTNPSQIYRKSMSYTYIPTGLRLDWESNLNEMPMIKDVIWLEKESYPYKKIKSKITESSFNAAVKDIVENNEEYEVLEKEKNITVQNYSHFISFVDEGIYICRFQEKKSSEWGREEAPYLTLWFTIEKVNNGIHILGVSEELRNPTPATEEHSFPFDYQISSTFQ